MIAALVLLLAGNDVDLQQFKPAPGSHDVLAVESPQVQEHMEWGAFLGMHYANVPMRLVDEQTGDVAASVLGHQTALDVGGALGFRGRWEIGFAVPVTLNQSAGAADSLDPRISGDVPASGFGDVRIVPKGLLHKGDRWALGVGAPISLPTAMGKTFLGHAGVTARPRVLLSLDAPLGLALAGNLGLAVRSPQTFVNFEQTTAVDYGLALSRPFRVRSTDFAAVATLAGESALANAGVEERPLELLAGLRWIGRDLTVTAGAGPGITRGAGTPDYRLFLVASRTPRKAGAAISLPPDGVTLDRATLKLNVIEPVYFGTDDDLIEGRSFPILEEVASFLKENPWIRRVRIEGHTDNQGGDQYNLNLSQLRAISIARFLVQKGVEPDVVEAKGFGLTQPVDTNDTPEGRAKNRRVEFVVLEIDASIAPEWAKQAMTPAPAP